MAQRAVYCDEQLAEVVRRDPILYEKPIKDFKDRRKWDLYGGTLQNLLDLSQVGYHRFMIVLDGTYCV